MVQFSPNLNIAPGSRSTERTVVFALLHAIGLVHIDVLQRLDDIIYDARLRATNPKTLDERIVIVDGRGQSACVTS